MESLLLWTCRIIVDLRGRLKVAEIQPDGSPEVLLPWPALVDISALSVLYSSVFTSAFYLEEFYFLLFFMEI